MSRKKSEEELERMFNDKTPGPTLNSDIFMTNDNGDKLELSNVYDKSGNIVRRIIMNSSQLTYSEIDGDNEDFLRLVDKYGSEKAAYDAIDKGIELSNQIHRDSVNYNLEHEGE